MPKYFQAENLMIELTDDQFPIIEFVKKRDDLILQLQKDQIEANSNIDLLHTELSVLTDSLKEALQNNVDLKVQLDVDNFQSRYESRRNLEKLANIEDSTGLTDRQIKEQVILKATTFETLDGRDDVVIDAMFDFIVNAKEVLQSPRQGIKENQKDSLSAIQRKDETNTIISYADYRNAQKAIGE